MLLLPAMHRPLGELLTESLICAALGCVGVLLCLFLTFRPSDSGNSPPFPRRFPASGLKWGLQFPVQLGGET